MSGRPTLSPDLKFFSRTRAVIKLLYRVRTNAEPLPGFTCWNSTMTYGSLSMRILSPLRNSLVSITSAIAALSLPFDPRARGLPQTRAIVQTNQRLKATSVIVDVDGDGTVGAQVRLQLCRQLRPRHPQLVPGPADVPFRRQREHDEVIGRQRPGDGHQPFRADGDLAGLPHLQRLRRLPHLRDDSGVLHEKALHLDPVRRAGLVRLYRDAVEPHHAGRKGAVHLAADLLEIFLEPHLLVPPPAILYPLEQIPEHGDRSLRGRQLREPPPGRFIASLGEPAVDLAGPPDQSLPHVQLGKRDGHPARSVTPRATASS